MLLRASARLLFLLPFVFTINSNHFIGWRNTSRTQQTFVILNSKAHAKQKLRHTRTLTPADSGITSKRQSHRTFLTKDCSIHALLIGLALSSLHFQIQDKKVIQLTVLTHFFQTVTSSIFPQFRTPSIPPTTPPPPYPS